MACKRLVKLLENMEFVQMLTAYIDLSISTKNKLFLATVVGAHLMTENVKYLGVNN